MGIAEDFKNYRGFQIDLEDFLAGEMWVVSNEREGCPTDAFLTLDEAKAWIDNNLNAKREEE